jgi:glycosyltransferase involved in cell wall biosynthesis
MYDRVIFYTEHAMHQAVGYKLLPAAKAAYANNTLDTDFIKEHYAFTLPPQEARLLFIGRLIPSKRLDLLLEYFYAIKARLPNLKLSIVGDGPESTRILAAAQRDSDIDWKGAIVDEAVIADIMGDCQLVFLPGLSGLSIVHAFCYGRPFVTVSNDNHGPEIVYLKDRWNGLLLEGDLSKDVDRIVDLLGHRRLLEEYSRNAYESAAQLSIHRWCEQIENAFDER